MSNHEFLKTGREPPRFYRKHKISDFLGVNNDRKFGVSLAEVGHNSGHYRDSQREAQKKSSESFEFISSRKNFLDNTALLEMPYILFKNRIINLTNKCPYADRKLLLLRASCVRKASQTIAIVISDSSALPTRK